jgi:hypothetical protein
MYRTWAKHEVYSNNIFDVQERLLERNAETYWVPESVKVCEHFTQNIIFILYI